MQSNVPPPRIRALNRGTVRPDGDFVLYWMVAQRRLGWNFALDRAVERAVELGRPLVILEALRCDYPWASVRHHRFVLDGMRDHAAATRDLPVAYLPYVEPEEGAGKGLLATLGERACAVVTDDAPHFFYPAMLSAAGSQVHVLMEAVDSNGLLPLREPQRGFTAAYHFRIHLHKVLLEHVGDRPRANPLEDVRDRLPDPSPLVTPGGPLASVLDRWPVASVRLLEGLGGLDKLPVDPTVPPVPFAGGPKAAHERLERFIQDRLPVYHEKRNDPDADAGSRLSPYLHWGHLSTHEVFQRVVEREGWTPLRVRSEHRGKRAGWWGMSPESEAFLDELLTWRELGFNEWVRGGPRIESFESLPEWAQDTLLAHADDERPHRYRLRDFERARTHDPLWNAAQRELLEEGTIHNYLRMLWGKKILEWSGHPREALETMLELNNRYAVDGRDPNSTTGIMWVLGRYDRGWPERAIYGKVRSMSSESTRRKVSVERYLSRFSGQNSLL